MRQHTTGTTSGWSNSSIITAYRESISYDANGNILKYLRKGTAATPHMDSLTYKYNYSSGQLVNNKLVYVKDSIPSGNYTVDIDDQANNNYLYDRIGNLRKDVAENIDSIHWTVYGKIRRIKKPGLTKSDPDIEIDYGYDPSGSRSWKKTNDGTTARQTFYVRDAQGNVLAVYSKENSNNLLWKEQHLYGSSRVGMWLPDTTIPAEPPIAIGDNAIQDSLQIGKRNYELTNHLGNVLGTISDKKIGNDSSGVVNYYIAEVLSQTDYYPGGMDMPTRAYSATNQYRYGFNGKEKDTENPVQYDYGFRIYDPRLVRFKSVDPLMKGYPMLTPYQFASNNPVEGVDLDGLEYASSKDVTVEIIRGMVKLKLENLSTVSQNIIKGSQNGCYDQFGNRTSSNCPPAGGYDTRIGHFSLTAPQALESDPDPSDANPNKRPDQTEIGKPIAKSTRLPDRRYNDRTVTTASPGGAKGLAIVQVAEMAITLGANLIANNKLSKDENKINSDISSFKKAAADVNYALSNGLIPKALQTQEYISDIINVVLSGESYFMGMDKDHGGENGPQILETGLKIYNTLSVKRNQYQYVRIKNALWNTSSIIQVQDPKYDAQYVKDNPPLEQAPEPKK